MMKKLNHFIFLSGKGPFRRKIYRAGVNGYNLWQGRSISPERVEDILCCNNADVIDEDLFFCEDYEDDEPAEIIHLPSDR